MENQNQQEQTQVSVQPTTATPPPIKTNALLLTIFIFVSFAIVFFVQYLFLPAIDTTGFTQESKANEYWIERVVQVKTTGANGSGFIVETKREEDGTYAYIATALHVVSSDTSAVTVRLGENYQPATLVGIADNVDLAFFKFKTNNRHQLFTVSDVQMGDKVLALGNAFNDGICATDGVLSKKESAQTSTLPALVASEVTCRIYEGMSGCPVYDSKGFLVGMGIRDEYVVDGGAKVYLGKSCVLPAEIVLTEYKRITQTNKSAVSYVVEKGENGKIMLTIKDGLTFVYDGGVLYANDQKVKTVCGKTVKSILEVIQIITNYDNLLLAFESGNQIYKITVLTDAGLTERKVA